MTRTATGSFDGGFDRRNLKVLLGIVAAVGTLAAALAAGGYVSRNAGQVGKQVASVAGTLAIIL